MEKINTTSLTELNGHQIELGVTKIRQKKYGPGVYLIPIFINEMTSLAQDKQGNVGAIKTDGDWMIYDESLHGELTFQAITTEEFFDKLKGIESSDSQCMFIIQEFDSLMSQNQYTRIGEILDAVNLDDYEETGIGVWMMSSSNPVSPLMRPIPREQKVSDLNEARVRFYDKCVEYYDKVEGQEGRKDLMNGLKPKDYEEIVKGYDALYMGGAPKEQ